MTKSNWKKIKLTDVADVVGGGTPSTKEASYWNGNVPWLTPKDLSGYSKRYISSGERNISKSGLDNSSAVLLPASSVLLTSRAPIGYIAIAKNPIATNQGFKSLVLKRGHYPEFYYYLLKANVEYIRNMGSGSTFKEVSGSVVKELRFSVPEYEEQKRIAEVLGAFDDKIELLQKQNKTLEEMAKAIFKSWFVDFDIVKAKQKGEKKEDIIKNYHLTGELYNLFPSSFVDSALGPIPFGWKADKLINRCTIMLGGTPSRLKKEYWKHGTIPWIASGKVNDFRIATPSEYITQEGLNNSATKLMPKRTTVIAITGATLGQISLTEIECCANQSVVSVLGDKDLFSEYIYFWIQHNINLLLSKQTGGAQQHINKNDVESLLVLVPSNNILKPYLHQVKPLFDKISNNIQQIKTLTELRDTLLPRLISGKIKV